MQVVNHRWVVTEGLAKAVGGGGSGKAAVPNKPAASKPRLAHVEISLNGPVIVSIRAFLEFSRVQCCIMNLIPSSSLQQWRKEACSNAEARRGGQRRR